MTKENQEQLSNPAGVLHEHLRAFRKSASDKAPARNVIAKRFSYPEEDEVQLRRALTLLDDLFVEVKKMIESIHSVDHARFLKHFPLLRAGLARVNLSSPSATAFAFISEAALESLDLCSARIAETYREIRIPAADLIELEEKISNAFHYIVAEEFEPEFKEIALDILGTLRKSLVDYQIRGIHGMRKAVEESIGKLYRLHCTQPDPPQEPLSRVKEIILDTEAIVARALTYGPYLVNGLQSLQLLLPPSP